MKKIFATFFLTIFIPFVVFAADWSGSMSIDFGLGTSPGSSYGGWMLVNPGGSLPEGSILGILSNFLNWILIVFGIIGIIGFVISGIIYLISAGEESMITRAKTSMKWSIAGIVVGLSGYVVMQAIYLMLSGMANNY